MGRMKLQSTPLAGLYEIHYTPAGDARGRFTRLFCEQELAFMRPHLHFTQINLSETRGRGTLRGMHYQTPPAAEAKLIRCLRGRVFDVAHLLYLHTAPWTPDCEAGLRHDDPRMAIAWPLPVTAISERDRGYALVDDAFAGVRA